jgi:hypothetical protein
MGDVDARAHPARSGLGRPSGRQRLGQAARPRLSPALIGVLRKGGRSIPVIDGIIVAAQHRPLIEDAQEEYRAAQEEAQARAKHKTLLDNWKLLARVLFMRQDVEARFESVYGRPAPALHSPAPPRRQASSPMPETRNPKPDTLPPALKPLPLIP